MTRWQRSWELLRILKYVMRHILTKRMPDGEMILSVLIEKSKQLIQKHELELENVLAFEQFF